MTMRLLTKAPDLQIGQVLAARLAAEGIEAQLRSEAFGPYPVSVGALAVTEIWVPEAELDRAQMVLAEGDDTAWSDPEEADERWARRGPSTDPVVSGAIWLIAAAMLLYLGWRIVSILT